MHTAADKRQPAAGPPPTAAAEGAADTGAEHGKAGGTVSEKDRQRRTQYLAGVCLWGGVGGAGGGRERETVGEAADAIFSR